MVLDITANHQGHFTFSLCRNNDIWADPDQDCFDRQVTNQRTEHWKDIDVMFFMLPRFVLKTGKDGSEAYQVNDYITGMRLVYVHLPRMWVEQNYWGSESRQIVSGPLTTPIVWWEFTDFFLYVLSPNEHIMNLKRFISEGISQDLKCSFTLYAYPRSTEMYIVYTLRKWS